MAISIINCSKKNDPKLSDNSPSFVAINIGVNSPAIQSNPTETLLNFTVSVIGCEKTVPFSQTFASTENIHIINLIETELGCVVVLDKFTFGTPENNFEFTPQTASSFAGAPGSQGLFINASNGKKILAVAGDSLTSQLNHKEKVGFNLIPFSSETPALFGAPIEFISPLLETVQSQLIAIKDLGKNEEAGLQQYLLTFACPTTLIYDKCRGQSLLDLRIRVAQTGTLNISTAAEVQAAVQATTGPIRPTINHLYGAGFRITATLPSSSTITGLNIAVGVKDSYRVYTVNF